MTKNLLSDFFSPMRLLELIWRRKLVIVATTATGILVALTMAVRTEPVYDAYMIVGPPENMPNSGGGSVLGQLGQFAGIQIDTPEESQTQLYRILLQGTRVAEVMQARYQLLQQMLPEAWNDKEKRWKERSESRLGLTARIKESLGLLHWAQPTTVDLANLLASRIVFTQLPKSSYYRVSYSTPNPQQGVLLLRQLNEVANSVYSEGLAKETQDQIAYLDEMLRRETRQNVREAQMRQLDVYSNRLVSLHSGRSLLAQVVQPPIASTTPTWPRPSLMLLLGAIMGFAAGLVLVVAWPVGLSLNDAARMGLRLLPGRRHS